MTGVPRNIDVLGIREDDVVYSVAKLFFAYGLGNGMSFPMSAGATTVLFGGRPTPDAVYDILAELKPTILCAVPTLFAAMVQAAAQAGRSLKEIEGVSSRLAELIQALVRETKQQSGDATTQ